MNSKRGWPNSCKSPILTRLGTSSSGFVPSVPYDFRVHVRFRGYALAPALAEIVTDATRLDVHVREAASQLFIKLAWIQGKKSRFMEVSRITHHCAARLRQRGERQADGPVGVERA